MRLTKANSVEVRTPYVTRIHRSHRLGNTKTEPLAPCGTWRLYRVRRCMTCFQALALHAAGRFNELQGRCSGERDY